MGCEMSMDELRRASSSPGHNIMNDTPNPWYCRVDAVTTTISKIDVMDALLKEGLFESYDPLNSVVWDQLGANVTVNGLSSAAFTRITNNALAATPYATVIGPVSKFSKTVASSIITPAIPYYTTINPGSTKSLKSQARVGDAACGRVVILREKLEMLELVSLPKPSKGPVAQTYRISEHLPKKSRKAFIVAK